MVSKMICLLAGLFALLLCHAAIAQKATDTLRIQRGILRKQFYQGDKSINRKEFKALLSSTEASQTILDEADNLTIFALNTSIIGTGLFAYSLHQYFFNMGFPSTLIPIGPVILGGTIPLLIIKRKKINRAIRVYNRGLKQIG